MQWLSDFQLRRLSRMASEGPTLEVEEPTLEEAEPPLSEAEVRLLRRLLTRAAQPQLCLAHTADFDRPPLPVYVSVEPLLAPTDFDQAGFPRPPPPTLTGLERAFFTLLALDYQGTFGCFRCHHFSGCGALFVAKLFQTFPQEATWRLRSWWNFRHQDFLWLMLRLWLTCQISVLSGDGILRNSFWKLCGQGVQVERLRLEHFVDPEFRMQEARIFDLLYPGLHRPDLRLYTPVEVELFRPGRSSLLWPSRPPLVQHFHELRLMNFMAWITIPGSTFGW